MRPDKKSSLKSEKKTTARGHKRGVPGYSKKTALLEEAITQMNAGKYGRSSAALKELLALDPLNMEARRLFATLHLRLGSLIPARQAFDSLINEAFERQDYWLAESLLREYLAAGPRCVPFLEKLGALFQEKGSALEAVTEYGKAIDILIEDPDIDNPQHAAELYAKIRDLAPASPIAFRLASFFDAQTGELIARPAAAPVEAEGELSVDTQAAAVSESAEIVPEPLAGPMPWEEVEDHSNSSSSTVTAAPGIDQAVSPDELSEADRQAELVPASQPSDQTDSPQTTESTSLPESHTAEPVAQVQHDDTAIETPVPVAPALSSSIAADDATAGSEPLHTISKDPVPPVPLQRSEPPSPQNIGAPVPESISAPMPWEHVQESTISIPDPVPDDRLDLLAQPEEPSTSALHEHSLQAKSGEDSSPQTSSTLLGTEDSKSVSEADEPSAAVPSSPDKPATTALPETSKGGFSWESVFDSAWKFGDKLSSTTPPMEVTQAESRQLGEEKPEQETASQAAPAVGPMPWDQIQETTITIPSAEAEAMAAEVPEEPIVAPPVLEGALAPRESVPDQTPPEAGVSRTDTATEEDSFSIHQPPASSPSVEPEFRLIRTDTNGPVELSQDSHLGKSSDMSLSAEVSAPAEPAAPVAAADQDSQPFLVQVGTQTPIETASRSEPLREVEIAPEALNPLEQTTQMEMEPVEAASHSAAVSIADPEPVSEVSQSLPEREEPPTDAGAFPEPKEAAIPVQMPIASQAPTESAQTPSEFSGNTSHWNTGEVAVQPHRPSPKKRKRAIAPSTEPASAPPVEERSGPEPIGLYDEPQPGHSEETGHDEAVTRPEEQKEEWIRTGESIRFIEPHVSSMEPAPQTLAQEETRASLSTRAAAVDVLFESSGRLNRTGSRERERVPEPKLRPRFWVKLARARIAVTLFIRSCFSTTRAIVTSLVALVVLSGALVAVAIGAIGLTWTIMEERPSPAFQSLTTSPQRTLSDFKKNGYLLLLGFDAPAGQDPSQAGYERKPDIKDGDLAAACVGGASGGSASANVSGGWFRSADPVAQFKAHRDTVEGWTNQAETALGRYKQWLKLSFEDWGYGQVMSPPCASILFAHQLYLADGFIQGMDPGIDRLETDMDAWRIVLGQAKTLPVKTMALEAISDDIAVASGLLVKPDFDGKFLERLTKMLRPLDQVELSIRWPMQSELVAASKTFDAQMKAGRNDELPLHAVVASTLPLPKQRRFNDYAEYYEASYKAAGEGRYGSLPKWANYIRFPANTTVDYLANPIENIIGLEPLPSWDRYNGMVVDIDAHLRLASLQAWLRRGPQDADLLARIAKAGPSMYDPYTGLPMLVNLKKGVVYSVGHDGKDQDADPQTDVVVAIPVSQPSAASSKSTPSRTK